MDLFIIDAPPLDVFGQMAFDELFAAAGKRGADGYFLRFYNWGDFPPSATFGYAQFFSDVKREFETGNFTGPFTRRPTGGGVVYHDADLTFSLVFNSEIKRAAQIYEVLHGAVNARLHNGELAGAAPKNAYAPRVNGAAGVCFSNPVENDILDKSGKKVLGGAIRKFGETVLYQGSLQCAGARGDERLKNEVRAAFEDLWGARFKPFAADGNFMSSVKENAEKIYGTKEWLQKF